MYDTPAGPWVTLTDGKTVVQLNFPGRELYSVTAIRIKSILCELNECVIDSTEMDISKVKFVLSS